ncbi:hypothetical protein CASFOL_031746 [Castilleja foliolosa]|uniref:Uncharacterized protein n=1 Tax=Castilleja foliolosa TaxID=1961234 RepID=A0ABD3C5J6_9LAMI
MVFLMVHKCEMKSKDTQGTKTEMQNHFNSGGLPNSLSDGPDGSDDANVHSNGYEEKERSTSRGYEEDIPKLMEYISMHCKDLGRTDNIIDDCIPQPLYDGVIYLNRYHINKLNEEFVVEPWTFEQHIGEAVFFTCWMSFSSQTSSGSSVQLGIDFLSPESLGEARKLSEEIRCLPNNHEAKLQALEVGKISLYAASSYIIEVQKLVFDPNLGLALGFEDPNLTLPVSQNLENIIKHRVSASAELYDFIHFLWESCSKNNIIAIFIQSNSTRGRPAMLIFFLVLRINLWFLCRQVPEGEDEAKTATIETVD